MRTLGAGGAAALGLSRAKADGAPTPRDAPASGEERAWHQLGLFEDPVMESQLLHFLAATYQQQADIGEVLDTARKIDEADPWSWPDTWLATAQRVRDMGEHSLARGHRISSGHAFLRAANYYRAALIHHPDPTHPSGLEAAKLAVHTYERAVTLLRLPAERVNIPYEGTHLLGYFFRAHGADGRAPLLIMHQGRDAWPEESRYIVDAALERGMHCLIFHGPGQGMAIREKNLPFRHDWERVVTPVVDFALRQHGVDPDRVILTGLSMGGALAPRAAAFEPRLSVLIPNPGVLSWWDAQRRSFAQYFPDAWPLRERDPAAFDAAIYAAMREVRLYDWYMRDAMHKHGAHSPSDYMTKLEDFDNTRVVDRIRCRTLVMDGTAEAFSAGEGTRLYDALSCPKAYLLFNEEDTGLLHCQEGAQAVANHRMFDWLDEQL
ncbi:MAG: alpha/beta fold hydrolase [Polyangiales bacterium]